MADLGPDRLRPNKGPKKQKKKKKNKNKNSKKRKKKKKKEKKKKKKEKQKKKGKGWSNQCSPCFCEGVAGRRPATPSTETRLMPAFRVSTGLHVEHRRLKAGDAPHEDLLKVERREFRCLGFRV